MNDMRSVIVPKSDQINADDLLGGPLTITVREVSIRPGTEQPVSIHFDGDAGKPYKPCKSMARVMVHCWGPDANEYVGRSMTLYCDPKVMWGGMAVGGIRISHMTHIDRDLVMALTATKGKRSPFTVKPLKVAPPVEQKAADEPPKRTAKQFLDALETQLTEALAQENARAAVDAILGSADVKKAEDALKNDSQERLQAIIQTAVGQLAERDDNVTSEAA